MLLHKMVLIHGSINIQMDGITQRELQEVMFVFGDHVVLHGWMLEKVELFGDHQIQVQHVVMFGLRKYILFNQVGEKKKIFIYE